MALASLITNPVNVEYLTGFKSSRSFLLLTNTRSYLFTDARYLEKAEKIRGVQALNLKGKENLEKLRKKHRLTDIKYEGDHLTVNRLKGFKKRLKKCKWSDGQQQIEKKRAIKTSAEIRRIKRSQVINEQIFRSIRGVLKPGVTELQIAQKIHELTYKFGAEKVAFEPIIAFGNHSSIPHHENTKRKLKKGDLILIDMGVVYQKHHSDMTRVLFTKSPTPEQEKIYNLVLEAQEAAIQALKPGKTAKSIDKITRKIFQKHDLEENFTHGTGHGVGLEIHELPSLAEESLDRLKPGMVLTIEPGLYFPGKFGVRIEDMILLTSRGTQNLTQVKKHIKHCIIW